MPKHEAELLAEMAEQQMVVEAVQTCDSYTTIYGRCLSALPLGAWKFVKKEKNCKRSMATARKNHRSTEPSTLSELVLEGAVRETVDGEDWVLYEDPPEEEDRLVVFASNIVCLSICLVQKY